MLGYLNGIDTSLVRIENETIKCILMTNTKNILRISILLNAILFGILSTSMSKPSNEVSLNSFEDTTITAVSNNNKLKYEFSKGILTHIEVQYLEGSKQLISFHSNGMFQNFMKLEKLGFKNGTQIYDHESFSCNPSGKASGVIFTENDSIILNLYRTNEGLYYDMLKEERLVFKPGEKYIKVNSIQQ